jgi:hypothetical protein
MLVSTILIFGLSCFSHETYFCIKKKYELKYANVNNNGRELKNNNDFYNNIL